MFYFLFKQIWLQIHYHQENTKSVYCNTLTSRDNVIQSTISIFYKVTWKSLDRQRNIPGSYGIIIIMDQTICIVKVLLRSHDSKNGLAIFQAAKSI